MNSCSCCLQLFATQRGGLLYPARNLRLVELTFVDVEIARFRIFAGAGWNRSQRCAAEEGHFHVAREDVERHEPALTLEAVKRCIPLHRFAHLRHLAFDERVEALTNVALPTRHRG